MSHALNSFSEVISMWMQRRRSRLLSQALSRLIARKAVTKSLTYRFMRLPASHQRFLICALRILHKHRTAETPVPAGFIEALLGSAADCESLARARNPTRYQLTYTEIVDRLTRSISDDTLAEASELIPSDCVPFRESLQTYAASRLCGENSYNSVVFAVRAELARRPNQYIQGYDAWLDRHYEALVERVKAALATQLPDGLAWRDEALLEIGRSRHSVGLVKPMSESEVIHLVNSNPADYVVDYERWLQERSEMVFVVLRPVIEEQLPERCELDHEAAIKIIYDTFQWHMTQEAWLQATTQALRHKATSCIRGLSEHYVKQSRSMLNQIESTFKKTLPDGVMIRQQPCLDLIVTLMETGVEPEQLAKQFFDRVGNNVSAYFTVPKRPKYVSDSPYSSQADQAMLSSVPPPRIW